MPDGAPEAARESINAALDERGRRSGADGQGVVPVGDVDRVVGGAGFSLLAALVALLVLPRKAPVAEPVAEPVKM